MVGKGITSNQGVRWRIVFSLLHTRWSPFVSQKPALPKIIYSHILDYVRKTKKVEELGPWCRKLKFRNWSLNKALKFSAFVYFSRLDVPKVYTSLHG